MGRWVFKLIVVLLTAGIGLAISFTGLGVRPNIGPFKIDYNLGSSYPAALISAFLPGPVQSDLQKRGLISTNPTDRASSTSVNVGGIQQLISSGMYFINPQNRLEIGPIPAGVVPFLGNPNYKYSRRLTQAWSILDDFSYIGGAGSVTIPANVDITSNSATVHNLYNLHLTLPSGAWVEAGVGWVNWHTSPIIYTYESYGGNWTVADIPSGTKRDVQLKIQIDSNNMATMSVTDTLSGKSITKQQKVGGKGHRVDFTQEQYSDKEQWTNTPKARFYNNQLMKVGSSDWVNWDSSVYTTWSYDPPMNEERGTANGQIYTDTWCGTAQ